MTEPTGLDLDKIRGRRERGVTWMDDGCPPADVDEPKGARATWIVLTRDVPALLDELVRLGRVGICGARMEAATSAGVIGNVCDLPARHDGWHGADNISEHFGPPTRVSWSYDAVGFVASVAPTDEALASARAEGIREGWGQAVEAVKLLVDTTTIDRAVLLDRLARCALASLTPDTEETAGD